LSKDQQNAEPHHYQSEEQENEEVSKTSHIRETDDERVLAKPLEALQIVEPPAGSVSAEKQGEALSLIFL